VICGHDLTGGDSGGVEVGGVVFEPDVFAGFLDLGLVQPGFGAGGDELVLLCWSCVGGDLLGVLDLLVRRDVVADLVFVGVVPYRLLFPGVCVGVHDPGGLEGVSVEGDVPDGRVVFGEVVWGGPGAGTEGGTGPGIFEFVQIHRGQYARVRNESPSWSRCEAPGTHRARAAG